MSTAIRTPHDLAPFIDHTLLSPEAGELDVARACDEARRHGFAAVCVRVAHAARTRQLLAGSRTRTAVVVDFPLGGSATGARVAEAMEAVRLGAEELDLVAPLPAVREGRWEQVLEDLRLVVGAVPVPVKVILETAALTRDQVVGAAAVARAAGAAWVKTSTGYGPGGATPEVVALLRTVVGDALGVKASGGIRSASQALAMVRAGATRIGASASVAIVEGVFDAPAPTPIPRRG